MRIVRLRLWALCCLVALACLPVAEAQPKVSRVEPANWWVGLPSPMLLVYGEGLAGAKIQVSHPGVRVARVEPGGSPKHLFVYLDVARTAKPGKLSLRISTAAGSATANFELRARERHQRAHQGFSPDDVIYLIMPDRFADGDPANNQPPTRTATYDRAKPRAYHGGDLRGIIRQLPYLRDLGVTAVWTTPVYANRFVDEYHGYHAVDLYSVDPHLGTLDDYRELAREAHRLGLKLIMDVVPNHVGPGHEWATAPPTPQWLHGTPEKHPKFDWRFDPLTDPYAVPQMWRNVVEGWFVDRLPDLNDSDERQRRYFIQNTMWWIETVGLDGLRLDTMPYVSRAFWQQFHREIHAVYPGLTTVGEVFAEPPRITAFFQGGARRFDGVDTGANTVFDFPLYFAIRNVLLRGKPATEFVDIFRQDWFYPNPQVLVTHNGNHDTKRFMGETGATRDKLKLAFSILLAARGIPQLYSGEEIAMEGGDDPDNRRDFPGGFPGDARNAFTETGRTPEQQEVFSHLQRLLALRKQETALRGGDQRHIFADDSAFVFLRSAGDSQLLCVANTGAQPRTIKLETRDTPLAQRRALIGLFGGDGKLQFSETIEIQVPPSSMVIYRVQ